MPERSLYSIPNKHCWLLEQYYKFTDKQNGMDNHTFLSSILTWTTNKEGCIYQCQAMSKVTKTIPTWNTKAKEHTRCTISISKNNIWSQMTICNRNHRIQKYHARSLDMAISISWTCSWFDTAVHDRNNGSNNVIVLVLEEEGIPAEQNDAS